MPLAKRRCSLTLNRQATIAVAYERLPGRRGSTECRMAARPRVNPTRDMYKYKKRAEAPISVLRQ